MNHSNKPLSPAENIATARTRHRDMLHSTEQQMYMAFDWACQMGAADRAAPLRVNLLPALRARYGNLLNERLLDAVYVFDRLEIPNEKTRDHARLLFDESAMANFYYIIDGVNEGRPIEWATESEGMFAPRERDPQALLRFIEYLSDPDVATESLLLSDHACGLLLSKEALKIEHDDLEREIRYQKRISDFFQAAFEVMVQADNPPSLDTIYQALKSSYLLQSAHGIGGEDTATYWQELGEIADAGSDHGLSALAKSQVQSDVWEALKALPEAAHLVLWKSHKGMDDLFDRDESVATYEKLFDDSDCVDKIVEKVRRRLMGSAMDDWQSMPENS
jgi:hypothetical protein